MINDVINEKEIVKKYLISQKLEQNKLNNHTDVSSIPEIKPEQLINFKNNIDELFLSL